MAEPPVDPSGKGGAAGTATGAWADLPRDLLALCLRRLSELCHDGGALTACQAMQLMAAASPCSAWRQAALCEVRGGRREGNAAPCHHHRHGLHQAGSASFAPVSLSPPTTQLQCCIRLGSDAEVLALAATPGPPCCWLQLPLSRADQHNVPSAWTAQSRLAAAASTLLLSPAFRRRSGAALAALHNLPLAAAGASPSCLEGLLALQALSSAQGRCPGHPDALRGSSLGKPHLPALAELEVTLPAGAALCHVAWPERLACCPVVAGSIKGGASLRIQPCDCGTCSTAAAGGCGFWASLRSLELCSGGSVAVHLTPCAAALRSCTSLAIVALEGVGGAAHAPAPPSADHAAAPAVDLRRWLEAVGPLFAGPALQVMEVRAWAMSLLAGSGGMPMLLAHSGPCRWVPHQHTAAGLPRGFSQAERAGSLSGELCRCSGGEIALRVWRCVE